MGADSHAVELAQIAAYLHDIGNLVNRVDHSQSGAVMAFRILRSMDMDPRDVATVVSAIGNHDEGTSVPKCRTRRITPGIPNPSGLQQRICLKIDRWRTGI